MAVKGRRAYGEGSLTYRQSKRLWVARIELEPGADDKRRRIEKAFRLQSDALDWMAKRKSELARYGRAADQTVTVAEWAERWLTEICAPRKKPSTMTTYRTNVDRWIVPAIGRKRLARLTPADVRAVAKRVREAGRSTATARSVHGTLRNLMEAARKEGLLTENAAKRVEPPPPTVGSRGALSVEQTRALLDAIAAHRDRAMLLTIILTGMRISEVLGLTWKHVDLGARTLTVAWQMKAGAWRHGCGDTCGRKLAGRCPARIPVVPDGMPYVELGKSYLLIPPKSGKPRTVPILPPLAEALTRHGDDMGPGDHGLVFHVDGRPVYADAARTSWREVVTSIGLPAAVTPHWARHSLATLLMEAGVDAKVIGEIVGHSTVAITRGTYQHVSSSLAMDAMKRFGELLA